MSEDGEKLNDFLNCISDTLVSKIMTRLDSLIEHKVIAIKKSIKKKKWLNTTKVKIIFDACAQMKRAFTCKDIYNFLQQSEDENKKITKSYIGGQIWTFAQKDILTLVKKGIGKSNPNVYIYNGEKA